MITQNQLKWETKDWQGILSDSITDIDDLFNLLEIDNSLNIYDKKATSQFSFRVPRGFIERMEKGNPHDPLLLQVLPQSRELENYPGFTKNPLQEDQYNPIPGLLHKYHGRVLLTVAGSCAINCRYCFRRHFPYVDNNPSQSGWDKAMEYIKNDTSITEVILSGGDPLIANDNYLEMLIDKIAAIPHVKTLRVHTRLPIVIPERITQKFIHLLTKTHLKPVMVLHVNHANELDQNVQHSMFHLRNAGVILLNQSALLKDINDSIESLIALSNALFDIGILPYYLNLLDKVEGAGHFDVSETDAKVLLQGMLENLPGYLVPKLVKDIPGKKNKIIVTA